MTPRASSPCATRSILRQRCCATRAPSPFGTGARSGSTTWARRCARAPHSRWCSCATTPSSDSPSAPCTRYTPGWADSGCACGHPMRRRSPLRWRGWTRRRRRRAGGPRSSSRCHPPHSASTTASSPAPSRRRPSMSPPTTTTTQLPWARPRPRCRRSRCLQLHGRPCPPAWTPRAALPARRTRRCSRQRTVGTSQGRWPSDRPYAPSRCRAGRSSPSSPPPCPRAGRRCSRASAGGWYASRRCLSHGGAPTRDACATLRMRMHGGATCLPNSASSPCPTPRRSSTLTRTLCSCATPRPSSAHPPPLQRRQPRAHTPPPSTPA